MCHGLLPRPQETSSRDQSRASGNHWCEQICPWAVDPGLQKQRPPKDKGLYVWKGRQQPADDGSSISTYTEYESPYVSYSPPPPPPSRFSDIHLSPVGQYHRCLRSVTGDLILEWGSQLCISWDDLGDRCPPHSHTHPRFVRRRPRPPICSAQEFPLGLGTRPRVLRTLPRPTLPLPHTLRS